ncbi:MAG: hypothetical protein VKK04_26425 [Synechococcales bacterium]|nr:hypothetical protein [Synechococcales bacterium]
MVMNYRNDYGKLLQFALKVLKYFLLLLFGLGIASLFTAALGAFQIAEAILLLMGFLTWRCSGPVFCLLAIAILVESIR